MEPIVVVDQLVKRFDSFTAVDGISFSVRAGEIFGLLGPNGAGKTTTIQMLLDVITPDSGTISIFGKDLARHGEEIRASMNFSSSYVSLPWNLTVEENLRVFGGLYGVQRVRERITELLAMFGLEEYRSTTTGKLSSGQLTRLVLAKALINRPQLLLLDEPTASLDPDIADKTRRILVRLTKKEGMTVLYTSHNMAEVESLCDRIAFMHHGKIFAQGSPAEVIASYGKRNLEDVFLHVARTEKEETV